LRQGSCGEEDKAMRRGKLWRRRYDCSFAWEANVEEETLVEENR